MANRLLRVDSRPINALVDATNYVMFDIGQPMHAFDAAAFPDKKLVAKQADEGQKLTLLDDQVIMLTKHATVISNGKKPLTLAGIMGGVESGVTQKTAGIIIEAGHFNATAVRTTAAHYKLRTEASTRFEKSIDPQQTTKALQRFLHIIEKNMISYEVRDPIVCLGNDSELQTIDVAHHVIEKKLGIKVTHEFVLKTLQALGFDVHMKSDSAVYRVTVPSFRSNECTIPEDIVEEVGRFYGLERIPHELPLLPLAPSNNDAIEKCYTIKQLLSYKGMREVRNYALYDEEFLKVLQWHPQKSLELKNPISENMARLVTSLVPNLFKNVYTNAAQEDILNFFEWNKIWPEKLQEITSLAGVFFDGKKSVDFYQKKDCLKDLFSTLALEVSWVKAHEKLAPWYHPYKTAFIVYQDLVLGTAGCVNPGFIANFLTGDAFIFELNADALLTIPHKQIYYKPLPKYQDTWRDISMLLPASVTVQQLKDIIQQSTATIFKVELIDFFQKEEWVDKRSVTLRFFIRDEHKTLSTADIEDVYSNVLRKLRPLGIEVR